MVSIVVGALGSIIVYRYTSEEEEPKRKAILYFVGFGACLCWMFLTAQEVVRVIKTLGLIMEVIDRHRNLQPLSSPPKRRKPASVLLVLGSLTVAGMIGGERCAAMHLEERMFVEERK